MRRYWRQWRALPPGERGQVLLLMLVQPLISLALRLRGFRRTQAWLERHSRSPTPHAATPHELAAAHRSAELAAIAGLRGPVTTTCLRQALAVYWVLRHRGLRPVIRLGVDRLGAAPDMHAWVELDGVPLAQPHLRHQPFQPATALATSASTASTTDGSIS